MDKPADARIPPNDLAAEAAVLSACMLDPGAYDAIGDLLRPDRFYSEAHRRIFEGIVDLRANGTTVDVVSLSGWLKSRDRLGQVGGMAYLTEVLDAAPALGEAQLRGYARQVHDAWRARQVIWSTQKYLALGYAGYGDAQQYASDAAQELAEIATSDVKRTFERISETLKTNFKAMSEAERRGARILGLPTGFDRYDRLTAGLQDGELTIVAARPGMGKTSWVVNVAVAVTSRGVDYDGPEDERPPRPPEVAMFSLEMQREAIVNRILCSEALVDLSRVRTGMLTPSDWSKLSQAAAHLARLEFRIDDTPAITLTELRAKTRRLANEAIRRGGRLGLVIVDYLQLMKGPDDARSREEEVSSLSRGLKALAKELNIPFIVLSQLNRAVETRGGEKGKRPQLSDLRESGAIEQDADNVVFIYREDYYDKETENRNVAELIIAKQRSGPTDTVKVRFDGQYTRFDNLADGEWQATLDRHRV